MTHTSSTTGKASRSLSTLSLLFTCLSAIIGSGWLFGAFNTARLAGPAAMFAWMIGAAMMLVIALTYIELGAMFPESGGMGRYAEYSHGPFAGLLASWSNWLSLLAIPPIEAVASVQYMAGWGKSWGDVLLQGGHLSLAGLLLASVFMVIYTMLNYGTVALFAKSNNAITIFKLVVPVLTGLGLIAAGFHVQNFTEATTGGFAPFGWAAVFTSVATSGIVFSFNGFQSPINLAGEAKNPSRSVPIAVVGGILIAALIYVLLQVAFIGAISPETLKAVGWHGLSFESPFAELTAAVGLHWLATTLYADAVISPSGAGITYAATSSRALTALAKTGFMPAWMGKLHPELGVPRHALVTNLVLSLLALYAFPNWEALAAVISVTCVIGFLTGPVSVAALRRFAPEYPRPLRLSGLNTLAPLAFICGSLLVYWSRWPLNGQIMLIVLAALPVYLFQQAQDGVPLGQQLRHGLWLPVYLAAMSVVSYLGSKEFGGLNVIPYGVDIAVVVVLAVGFYLWGVQSGTKEHLPPARATLDE